MAKGTRYTPEFKAKAVRLLDRVARFVFVGGQGGRTGRQGSGAPETPLRWHDKMDATAVYGYRKTHARSSAQGRDPVGIGRGRVTNVMRESGVRGVRRGGMPVATKPAKGNG